jgi:hypothetical protein
VGPRSNAAACLVSEGAARSEAGDAVGAAESFRAALEEYAEIIPEAGRHGLSYVVLNALGNEAGALLGLGPRGRGLRALRGAGAPRGRCSARPTGCGRRDAAGPASCTGRVVPGRPPSLLCTLLADAEQERSDASLELTLLEDLSAMHEGVGDPRRRSPTCGACARGKARSAPPRRRRGPTSSACGTSWKSRAAGPKGERARAEHLRADADRLGRLSEDLQRALLLSPGRDRVPGMTLWTAYEPAEGVDLAGGDFFDAFLWTTIASRCSSATSWAKVSTRPSGRRRSSSPCAPFCGRTRRPCPPCDGRTGNSAVARRRGRPRGRLRGRRHESHLGLHRRRGVADGARPLRVGRGGAPPDLRRTARGRPRGGGGGRHTARRGRGMGSRGGRGGTAPLLAGDLLLMCPPTA